MKDKKILLRVNKKDKENLDLEKENKELEEENKELEKENKKLEEEIKHLEKENEELENENSELQDIEIEDISDFDKKVEKEIDEDERKSKSIWIALTAVVLMILVIVMSIIVSMARSGFVPEAYVAETESSIDESATEITEEVESEEVLSEDAEESVAEEQVEEVLGNPEEEIQEDSEEAILEEQDTQEESDDYKDSITDLMNQREAERLQEYINSEIEYIDPSVNYPLEFTSVDESYFEDALFIGDSRMYGFAAWSNLPATFYSAVGFQLYRYETFKLVQTDEGKAPLFDALPYDAFTKIYIKVGLNEMGWGNEEMFEAKYAEFITRLREMEPRATIYIHGLLPVTREQDAAGDSHNNTNIRARNEALANFAVTQNAYFINGNEIYADEEGYLPTEKSSDGIHLKASYIEEWKQYIMNHAIVVQ